MPCKTPDNKCRPAKAARLDDGADISHGGKHVVTGPGSLEVTPLMKFPSPRTAEALMSAASIWNECRAQTGRTPAKIERVEHPVPNYRIEVSPIDGVIHATVSLPLLESARAVDLEVYRGELLVAVDGIYSMLKVRLPSPVDEESVIAKFDRRRRELDLTLHARKPSCSALPV